MHDKELRRGEVLGRVKRGELKLSEAARMLDISYRQTKRIWRRYSAGGTKALKHGNVGRVSNGAKPPEVRKRVLQLVREHYSGEPHERFGPTLAAEHLWTDHDLKLSVRTLRRWMLAGRPVEPPTQAPGAAQAAAAQSALRRADPGRRLAPPMARRTRSERLPDELRGRCNRCGAGPFLKRGNDLGGADLLEAWVRQYGVPKALYCDWKNVYKRQPTAREAIEGIGSETQFGRMCAKLGIRGIVTASQGPSGAPSRHPSRPHDQEDAAGRHSRL